MRALVGVAASFMVLSLAGCSTREPSKPAYLSEDAQLVGGGVKIEWQAPQAGTAYLMEKRTGKLVETVTLESGGHYGFSVESVVQADELQKLLGIEIAKAQFLLYFKPAGGGSPDAR